MPKRILVVDDSASVRQQVGLALQHAGFEVLEAVDGEDGEAQIAAHRDLALVICDVNMPKCGGIELLERLKAMGRIPELPVVMLTTEGQAATIQRARQVGAKGWMTKPFKAHLLIGAVQKLTGG